MLEVSGDCSASDKRLSRCHAGLPLLPVQVREVLLALVSHAARDALPYYHDMQVLGPGCATFCHVLCCMYSTVVL
jgi:hypothetical protein